MFRKRGVRKHVLKTVKSVHRAILFLSHMVLYKIALHRDGKFECSRGHSAGIPLTVESLGEILWLGNPGLGGKAC